MPSESVDFGVKARMIGDMAKRQVVTITDDIDGREGAETVTFAYAGRSYEIDLREKNRTKLEKALEPFIGAARRAADSGPGPRKAAGHAETAAARQPTRRVWIVRRSGHGQLSTASRSPVAAASPR